MQEARPILSISMLVSGREEMKKSLDSLHYFTESFPCEIILVDTGCNAEQRALAERYADKIVDFEWCNDFAAARNAGLKEARGEWFMYLDDDEWFDDPQQIVTFFTSGEYKRYRCASYVQRNYQDKKGTMYDDAFPSRMIKLTDRTVFVGRIHEFLTPYELPKKEFTDFVHHYGYVYESEEERMAHAQRNIQPLLQMRKDYPGEPRWMCQLAQEYYVLAQYEDVFQTCKEGLEEWAGMKQSFIYAPSHIGALYAFLLMALESLGRYEEEEEWLQKAFQDSNMKLDYMEPNLACYCLQGAKLYNTLQDYGKSRDYFRRYIDYAKRLKGDRSLLESGAALVVSTVFQEIMLYPIVLACMNSAILTEDYALAEDAFYMLDWQDWRLLNQREAEQKMVEAFCDVSYHPLWVKILQTLVSRPQGIKEMVVVFMQREIQLKQLKDWEKLSRLHRLVAELDYEHRYLLYGKILWTEEDPDFGSEEERRDSIEKLFEKLIDQYQDEILEVKQEIWDVAQRQEAAVQTMLPKIDGRKWKQMLEEWSRTAALWEIKQWEERLALWRSPGSWQEETGGELPPKHLWYCNLFAVKALEARFRFYEESCPGLAEQEELLWKYADAVLELYRPYYMEFVFEEMQEALPTRAQLALRLKELRRYREEDNDLKALESARGCLGLCPYAEEAVEVYAKSLRDEVQRRGQEQDAARKEFDDLVAALKRAAAQQMEKGELAGAREILLQVQACAPEDEEVREMLKKTEETKKI